MNFIVYGTKIKSDIRFPLNLSYEAETRYEIELCSKIPETLASTITCGFPFYSAHGRKIYLYSNRLHADNTTGQPWCYEVKDVVKFYWNCGEQTIFYRLDEKSDANLLGFWFIHLFLPFFLTMENKYNFFHAGAVEIAGKPVLFIAPSMGGKSTMTDYFIKQGHPFLSDDKVPTFFQEGKFMIAGAHPYHRPYRKFEELGYRVNNFTKTFKPIHAFYVLERGKCDIAITIQEIKGVNKFDTLLSNYLYLFSHLKPKQWQYLSNMLSSIKVFRVKVPWTLTRLCEVHISICKHSNSVMSTHSFSDK